MERTRGLTTDTLKLIAFITMIIDHIGACLVIRIPSLMESTPVLYLVLRAIGRISFPIFCFLIVEGYLHTKSLAKYMTRIGIFAAISEIPFDMACFGDISLKGQNVMCTFLICLTMLYLFNKISDNKANSTANKLIYYCSFVLGIPITSALCYALRVDYPFLAPCLTGFLYYLKDLQINKKKANIIKAGTLMVINVLLVWTFTFLKGSSVNENLSIMRNMSYMWFELFGFLAMPFLLHYNGQRGSLPKKVTRYMYLIYPVHLFIIGCIVIFIAV